MRAAQVTEIGQPPVATETAPPVPGAGEVLLEIEACGVNFADTLMVVGQYQERKQPPFTLGLEAVGRVAAMGPQTQEAGLSLGDRVVAATSSGAMAEFATAPAALTAPVPDQMPAAEAAALPVAYGTSHLALSAKAGLQPGERLLVLGAAGGVGLTAVEIGALMGAEVIAVARGAARLETARAKGAAHLIDSDALGSPMELKDAVRALGGADVIYDPVGGALGEAAFRAATIGARLLPIGFASGDVPVFPANILLVKNQTVIGFYWGAHVKAHPTDFAQSVAACVRWRAEGALTPHVSDVLPLERAAEALDLLKTRRAQGKVVVSIKP